MAMKPTIRAMTLGALLAGGSALAHPTVEHGWKFQEEDGAASIHIHPTLFPGAEITCRQTCTDWKSGRYRQECAAPELPLIQPFELTMTLYHQWGTEAKPRFVEQPNGTMKREPDEIVLARNVISVPVPQSQIQIVASRVWRNYAEESMGGIHVNHDGLRFWFRRPDAVGSRRDQLDEEEETFRRAWRELEAACSRF